MSSLPPCGLYCTTVPIGEVSAGRLVQFHNHGDPGPGVYLPVGWRGNRARFAERGTTLPDPALARTLEPRPAEGLYRVMTTFVCCERACRSFEPETLVQLGYDANARPILFLPEWLEETITLPSRGTRIDLDHLARLVRLRVPNGEPSSEGHAQSILH